MYSGDIKLFVFLIILGLGVILLGIHSQKGYSRGMYLFKGGYGHPSGYIYAAFPLGMFFFLLASLFFTFDDSNSRAMIVIYGGGPLFALAIILMIWQPRWLKPWWLKWLEDNYGDIIEQMLEEARHTEDFAEITPDEDSLATWASGVACKYRR